MITRLKALIPFALVVACGSQHGAPAVLHLAAGGGRDAAIAPTSEGSASGDYVLVGDLPSGTPNDAHAWTLSRGHAEATALQKALGSKDVRVSTAAGQPWSLTPCAGPDSAVSSTGTVSSCAVAAAPDASAVAGSGSSGSGGAAVGSVPAYSPPPTPADVPSATVRTAVEPVFTALGIDMADVTIVAGPYGGSGSYEPTIGGLRTVGLTTRVDVTRDGTVLDASGWLGHASAGDPYPLVTARKAFEALPIAPHLDLCQLGPDGKGCVEPEPQRITGAHLGLLAEPLQDGGTILVPAWLFDVKGSSFPLAQVAVQGTYLGAPSREPVNTTSDAPAPPPGVTEPVGPSPAG